MATTQLQITLPDEVVTQIESRIAKGEFSSPSELILSLLHEEQLESEQWLREEIRYRCEHADQHPEGAITAEQMLLEHEEDIRSIQQG